MKKILVHLHLYYHEQLDYFIDKFSNIIDCDWELYVTVVEQNERSTKKILKFRPNAKIIQVENRGYDVCPFIQVIKMINLDDFDYILKLHTKGYQNIQLPDYKGYNWRNNCVDALVKNKTLFKNNLKLMEKNEKIGMIGSQKFLFPINDSSSESTYLFDETCCKLGINIKKGSYISGTMFLCKSKLMQIVKKFNLTENDFSKSVKTGDAGTLAHVMERLLCTIIEAQGYYIYGIKDLNYQQKIKNMLQTIFSIKNDDIHKVITICGIKLKFKIKD